LLVVVESLVQVQSVVMVVLLGDGVVVVGVAIVSVSASSPRSTATEATIGSIATVASVRGSAAESAGTASSSSTVATARSESASSVATVGTVVVITPPKLSVLRIATIGSEAIRLDDASFSAVLTDLRLEGGTLSGGEEGENGLSLHELNY
jgi:hypothetical protein